VFIKPAPPPSTYGVEIAARFVNPEEIARPYHGLRVGSQRNPQFCQTQRERRGKRERGKGRKGEREKRRGEQQIT
jgi:hypothetical protein